MNAEEVVERSPIRALEQRLQGGLGPKGLGAVLARSGVGKTASLVQIGLHSLLSGKTLLHVSNETPVGHLRSFYDELFRGIERVTGMENASDILLEIERRRLLISQPGPMLHLHRLKEAASVCTGTLGTSPDVVIVEGFDLDSADEAQVAEFQEFVASLGAELWLSVRLHRDDPVTHPRGYPEPVGRFEDFLDVILLLEPCDERIRLRILKNRDHDVQDIEPLELDSVTMQLTADMDDAVHSTRKGRERFVLHSGGAKGAEAAFGEMAERYGIREINFSFDGHGSRIRNRGLQPLSDSDLRLGDVSLRYVSHRLGRVFPSIPAVRRVIQSIWHQVRPCQQVFVIGVIQEDGTVRGGTGWGAELARRWNKDLYVFDQEKDGWFHWDGAGWISAEPIIESPKFTGTGTAHLKSNGRAAIEALFERSFGNTASMIP